MRRVPFNYRKSDGELIGWGQIIDNGETGTVMLKPIQNGKNLKKIFHLCTVELVAPYAVTFPNEAEAKAAVADSELTARKASVSALIRKRTTVLMSKIIFKGKTYTVDTPTVKQLQEHNDAIWELSAAGGDPSVYFPFRVELGIDPFGLPLVEEMKTIEDFKQLFLIVKQHISAKRREEAALINTVNTMTIDDLNEFKDTRTF